MNIGVISDYNSMWQNYRVPSITEIKDVQPLDKDTNEVANTNSSLEIGDSSVSGAGDSQVARSNIALEDVSLSFNVKEDFGSIGLDSDINTLDMEKAISDMRKDQLLQQYQYFVGDSSFNNKVATDGIVIIK